MSEEAIEALGLRWETDDDGHRPHRFPQSAIGEEVLAWVCQACGQMVREYGDEERSECSVNWRSSGKRRLVSDWQEAP